MDWSPLPRAEVVKAIERKNPARVPIVASRWWGEGFRELHGAALDRFACYPEDAAMLLFDPIDYAKMGLSWKFDRSGSHDSRVVLDDWAKLDEFIAKLPDPERDSRVERVFTKAEELRRQDRYILVGWWFFFFERPWAIRGMENLMVDYYEHKDEVHRLHGALCDLYCGWLRRAAREMRPDGFFTSDDLGNQRQPMMSPATFDEMIKPYYDRVGRTLREGGMHWWLHSCGNNTPLLPALIDAGVNVLHPVQKGTMDEAAVAREFGERITFLAGFDVQHTLVEKDPAGVRREVRFLIDTFDRPDGGMLLGVGNGILPGTPLENVEAYLDEAFRYGAEHRQRYAGGAPSGR